MAPLLGAFVGSTGIARGVDTAMGSASGTPDSLEEIALTIIRDLGPARQRGPCHERHTRKEVQGVGFAPEPSPAWVARSRSFAKERPRDHQGRVRRGPSRRVKSGAGRLCLRTLPNLSSSAVATSQSLKRHEQNQRPEIRLETRRFLGRRPEFLAVCRVVEQNEGHRHSVRSLHGVRTPEIDWPPSSPTHSGSGSSPCYPHTNRAAASPAASPSTTAKP